MDKKSARIRRATRARRKLKELGALAWWYIVPRVIFTHR